MKLSHINFQQLCPFADKFLLYICFPKRFPLHFHHYPIDKFKKKLLHDQAFPFTTNSLANSEFYEKVMKIRRLREKGEKDPDFVMQVYDPKTEKFLLLCKNKSYGKFLDF